MYYEVLVGHPKVLSMCLYGIYDDYNSVLMCSQVLRHYCRGPYDISKTKSVLEWRTLVAVREAGVMTGQMYGAPAQFSIYNFIVIIPACSRQGPGDTELNINSDILAQSDHTTGLSLSQ